MLFGRQKTPTKSDDSTTHLSQSQQPQSQKLIQENLRAKRKPTHQLNEQYEKPYQYLQLHQKLPQNQQQHSNQKVIREMKKLQQNEQGEPAQMFYNEEVNNYNQTSKKKHNINNHWWKKPANCQNVSKILNPVKNIQNGNKNEQAEIPKETSNTEEKSRSIFAQTTEKEGIKSKSNSNKKDDEADCLFETNLSKDFSDLPVFLQAIQVHAYKQMQVNSSCKASANNNNGTKETKTNEVNILDKTENYRMATLKTLGAEKPKESKVINHSRESNEAKGHYNNTGQNAQYGPPKLDPFNK